jgi:hypothetical protein
MAHITAPFFFATIRYNLTTSVSLAYAFWYTSGLDRLLYSRREWMGLVTRNNGSWLARNPLVERPDWEAVRTSVSFREWAGKKWGCTKTARRGKLGFKRPAKMAPAVVRAGVRYSGYSTLGVVRVFMTWSSDFFQ